MVRTACEFHISHSHISLHRVAPPGGIGEFNNTGIPIVLHDDGSTLLNGIIGVSPFEFGPYKVEKQGLFNCTHLLPSILAIHTHPPAFINADPVRHTIPWPSPVFTSSPSSQTPYVH